MKFALLVLLCVLMVWPVFADELVIQSFGNGQLRFNQISGAQYYRVEWAPALTSNWSSFQSAASSLGQIIPAGPGNVTVSVPMFYRVKAVTASTNPPMVWVQGGSFTMGDNFGDNPGSNEYPVHPVELGSFFIDKHEVTNDEMCRILNWAHLVGLVWLDGGSGANYNMEGDQRTLLDWSEAQITPVPTGMPFPFGWSFAPHTGKGNFPCCGITWYGAAAYCNYRSWYSGLSRCYDFSNWRCNFSAGGYRLPTEAEWEYAARGGQNEVSTPYSGSSLIDQVAWYSGNAGGASHTVGTKAANELGIHDMSGNLVEWCNDWYRDVYYDNAPLANPTGPAQGSGRGNRGGGWSYGAYYCRVAYRYAPAPDYGGHNLGFRAVLPPGQ